MVRVVGKGEWLCPWYCDSLSLLAVLYVCISLFVSIIVYACLFCVVSVV